MALYIKLKNNTPESQTVDFKEMQNIPFGPAFITTVTLFGAQNRIDWIWASDDEKNYIADRFDNIPITKGNMCKWVGDMANFICANLK